MTILPLIYSPDPRLKQTSKPVRTVNDKIRTLMDDMVETMHDRKGIGLAAIQVGIAQRVLVMDLERGSDRYAEAEKGESSPLYIVNPKIVKESEETNVYEEGCLSFPGQYAEVVRPKIVTVEYLDYDGKKQTLDCDELLSTCIQHEIDHLNGITFVDHISRMKRDMILKKMKKSYKSLVEDQNENHIL